MTTKTDPVLAIVIIVVVAALVAVAAIQPTLAIPMILPTLTTILASLRGRLVEAAKE